MGFRRRYIMFLFDKLKRKKSQAAPVVETDLKAKRSIKKDPTKQFETKYCVTFLKKDNTSASYYIHKKDNNSTATQ